MKFAKQKTCMRQSRVLFVVLHHLGLVKVGHDNINNRMNDSVILEKLH